MAQDLEKSVIRILNQNGHTAGTGFLFEECPGGAVRALTCAHVVRAAGSAPGQTLRVQTYLNGVEMTALVETRCWSETEDTAFLLLKPRQRSAGDNGPCTGPRQHSAGVNGPAGVPNTGPRQRSAGVNGPCTGPRPAGCAPVRVGSARGSVGHEYSSLGFPKNSFPAEAARPFGKIDGVVRASGRRELLELVGESMGHGMSGAPVLDLATDRVIGMVASHRDEIHTRVIYAVPLDSLPRGLYGKLSRLGKGGHGPVTPPFSWRGLSFSIAILAALLGLVFLSSLSGLLPFPLQSTPTATPSPTVLPFTVTPTASPTILPTATETAPPPATQTPTPSLTVPPTATLSLTPTITPTPTVTSTPTLGVIKDAQGHIMVPIPAGTFEMGSQDGQADERPVHPVFLDSFYIDKYEVTNAQYRQCIEAGVRGCTAPRDAHYRKTAGSYDEYPVGSVNWMQAQAYCEWRGGRLPGEAQWEKAARGNTASIYPWGDDPPTCDLALFGGCARDTKGKPALRPVGSYPRDSSVYDVHDLAGSMIEWVFDWYGENYYEIFSALPFPNPLGPATGTLRVTRGGGWSPTGVDNSLRMRISNREMFDPHKVFPNVGFRCVKAVDGY